MSNRFAWISLLSAAFGVILATFIHGGPYPMDPLLQSIQADALIGIGFANLAVRR